MSIPLPRLRRRARVRGAGRTGAALALPLALSLALLLAGACAGEPSDEAAAGVPETGVRPTPPAAEWTPPRRASDTSGGAGASAAASDTAGEADPAATASDTPDGTSAAAETEGGTAAETGTAAGSRRVDVPDLGHTLGSDRAPVQVLEFSDFGCGYCRQFHLETWPALEEEFVETGKVEWTYVPMTLGMFGASSIDAAEAGECAIEQGRFPPVRERLFQEQARWKRSSDAHAVFREIVREEGLDVERWQSCMDEDRRLARVDNGTRLAQQIGVRGTPTFLVLEEGAIPGAVPLDVFRQILDQVHARRSGS